MSVHNATSNTMLITISFLCTCTECRLSPVGAQFLGHLRRGITVVTIANVQPILGGRHRETENARVELQHLVLLLVLALAFALLMGDVGGRNRMTD